MSEAQPAETKWRWDELWKKEDWWAIWLGFALLVAGLAVYLPRGPEGLKEKVAKAEATMAAEQQRAPFKTVAWYQADDAIGKLKATDSDAGKWLTRFMAEPASWKSNPLHAFYMSEEEAEAAKQKAIVDTQLEDKKKAAAEALAAAGAAEKAAEAAGFKDKALNQKACDAVSEWRTVKGKVSSAEKKTKVKAVSQIPWLIGLMVVMGAFFGVGAKAMGQPFPKFLVGFAFVFVIAIVSHAASNQSTMKTLGVEYAAWAILIGLIISNTVGTPEWVKPAVQTEYYIKTGLVLLGAEILFGKILLIGVPGIFVAWVVTPIVLVTTFIFGQKILKIPSKTLNITISADMSVCGVSAAIATAAACRAKKEELTLAVGLSLVFTSIMMVVMPAFIKATGMPVILGGAWIGGTVDATGAVAAAGAILGDKALYVAATVKMIQNVLIGVIAFFVALYWTARVERVPGQRVSAMEIWYRFPKFVLGFITASIAFSILAGALGDGASSALIDHGVIGGMAKLLRNWFFCLAFVSIGLATNFRELKEYFRGGKPLILYVCGQSFNLALTLAMAYFMFYVVFRHITECI